MAKQHGEIMIDHRASPGLPEDVARAQGLDPKLCAEGKVFEAATLTCAHCRCTVIKSPLRQKERASCPKCNFHYICDQCAVVARLPDYNHTPFEKIADQLFSAKGIMGNPLNPTERRPFPIVSF